MRSSDACWDGIDQARLRRLAGAQKGTLEVATARLTGANKERVSWLKKTLGTKDEKQAKVLAKPVMMKFDRILAQAEALVG